MEIIEIKMMRGSCYFSYISYLSVSVWPVLFFWGYFGVGSGTHYMYSRRDDDDVIKFMRGVIKYL